MTFGITGVKTRETPEGGTARLLINKTGAPSVKGYVVTADTTQDFAVKLIEIDIPAPVGIIYEDGVPDGSPVWVVTDGIADIYFANAVNRGTFGRGFVTGDAGYVSGQALCEALPTAPFATDKHFYEICHPMQTTAGPGLARCLIHFN